MISEAPLSMRAALDSAASKVSLSFKKAEMTSILKAFRQRFGVEAKSSLVGLYETGLELIGDEVTGYAIIVPGRRSRSTGEEEILEGYIDISPSSEFCPVLSDGCGNFHCVRLSGGDERVYFFETIVSVDEPAWCSALNIPDLVVSAATAASSGGGWPHLIEATQG